MSVDEQFSGHLPNDTLIDNRRNSFVLHHGQNYAAHTRSLSHFGDHDATRDETIDAHFSSQRKAHKRPPITDWLGPRTAKAFKAAGLLVSEANSHDSNASQQFHSYSEPGSPSLSAPSSPLRPHSRPTSSYTADFSPHSLSISGQGPSYPSYHTPHPRSASVAASAISARSGGSVRSASVRSGSVRSASTAPTSLSTSLGPATPAQAAREYLMQNRNQHQLLGTSTSSSSASRRPSTVSLEPPSSTISASSSEIQLLKDQHSAETSALLAALSDAQRTARVLRVENAELRDALRLAEQRQDTWEQERLQLKLHSEELEAQLSEARTPKREVLKIKEEIKVLQKAKAGLELKLDEAETHIAQAEAKLCVMNDINSKNQKLRQALHTVQVEKARVEAEAVMRNEASLHGIEQLETALAKVNGDVRDTIGTLKTTERAGLSTIEGNDVFKFDSSASSLPRSEIHPQGKRKIRLQTSSEFSLPSSSASSRPPSVFPVPPENMSLLMHEEAEDMSGIGERSTSSNLDDSSSLDALEYNWRRSMDMPSIQGRPSTSFFAAHTSSPRRDVSPTHAFSSNQTRSSDHSNYLHPPDPSDNCSISSGGSSQFKYEDDEGFAGNTTFYDPDSAEGDSIISEDDSNLNLDPDPTVRSNLHLNLSTHNSLSTSRVPEAVSDDDPATTSFEGTGTPGSPGSLLWMHPLDERHLGDLSGSIDSLRLS
ncbi:hypothetical protein F5878DRAFT_642080 [Lentinula raphanica]|uniref:Uncharacterized protein n=1 Tax=Lentinula raphanica TaxID=153919 RepID=A0AA38P8J0_9AGAR|nr:hypothetical protein F5878DRAFT_642080 [Lentinula raphanica]